jgi:hypothetical protein
MDQELKCLLSKGSISDETSAWLEGQGCTNVEIFACWADSIDKWSAIARASPNQAEAAEAPRLKAAWRRAVTLSDRRNRRAAEGLPLDDIDEPLPLEQQRDINNAFLIKYGLLELDSTSICCDSQFAAFRRSLQAHQPSLFAVGKIRSVHDSVKEVSSKRSRVGDGIELVQRGTQDDADFVASLWDWSEKHFIYMTSLAVAGCFDIWYKGEKELYVHLSCVMKFHRCFKLKVPKLRIKYTESSILVYIEETEKAFRARANELARSMEGPPYGKCLVQVSPQLSTCRPVPPPFPQNPNKK